MPDELSADEWRAKLRVNMSRNAGYAKPGPRTFNTALPPQAEAEFRAWVGGNGIPFNPDEPAQDYDMRGFWQALMSGDKRAISAINQHDGQIHFPDIWKTPMHETFSAESQYANDKAPVWRDDRYLADKAGTVLWDEARPRGLQAAVGPREKLK